MVSAAQTVKPPVPEETTTQFIEYLFDDDQDDDW